MPTTQPNAQPNVPFTGFPPQCLDFFSRLAKNNNRTWFVKHRSEYLQFVVEPFRLFAEKLAPVMQEIDPLLNTDPKRAVSRIYRDSRFSQNKLPYRPNVWIAFKRNVENWTGTPVFFFEITQNEYLVGMGTYCAKAASMRNFRCRIDDDPAGFEAIIKPLQRNKFLKLEADPYKRPLPCEHAKIIQPWYQSKSLAVIGSREPDATLYSAKLLDFVITRFIQLKPLYDFLWKTTVVN